MEEIKAYKCEYCKKYSKNKGVITRHEKTCYHRPEMKACATCKFLGKSTIKAQTPFGDGTAEITVCRKGITLTREFEGFGTRVELKHDCSLYGELKEGDRDYYSIKEFCEIIEVDYNPSLDAYVTNKAVLMCMERDLNTMNMITLEGTVKGYPYSVLNDIFNEPIT